LNPTSFPCTTLFRSFISIVVVIDSVNGKIVTGPQFHARGLAENQTVFDPVVPRIVDALEEALADGVYDSYELQQILRRLVGSFAGRRLRRRPMIIPTVLQV